MSLHYLFSPGMNIHKTPFILGVFGVLACLLFSPPQLVAFSILQPKSGQQTASGETILVKVDLGDEIGIHAVKFYWYREGEVPINAQQAEPQLVATGQSSPPFGGRLVVPKEAIGRMRLLAIGESSGGRLTGRMREEFDEVLLDVQPKAELQRITFSTEQPWRLPTIGQVLNIPVVGEFSDAVTRSLGGEFAGSQFLSSDKEVILALPSGLVRVVGPGKATVKVINRGKQGHLDISVVGINEEPNEWPVADAGEDLTVKSGAPVVLSGLKSLDPDGDPLRYEWSQTRGVTVSLLDPWTVQPSFVAPKVSAKRLFQFQLRVTDMAGSDHVKGADSLVDTVKVWVVP